MKISLFFRIAFNNILKNYRFFIPRILAEIGLTASFYIVMTLTFDERIKEVRGGDFLPPLMVIGCIIIGLLSFILIFYTNSFLMKQRKREFGLYNVLGMEKKHITSVLFFESFLSSLLSILLGLGFGVVFYKLCTLLICRLLQTDSIFGFYFISGKSLIPVACLFLLFDILAYLFNCISVYRLNPIEMLKSGSKGEKEPKIKWLLLLIGILSLGSGYYIAVTVGNPLKAITLFFLAVLLVIIGTYCLFTAGSVFILRLLKKKRNFYYNKKHFISVSGLLYRMKGNAVGLASICILSTGVLVMISTTVSLYAGLTETIDKNYPQEMYLSAHYETNDESSSIPQDVIEKVITEKSAAWDLTVKNVAQQETLTVSYVQEKNSFISKPAGDNISDYDSLASIVFMTQDVYRELTKDDLKLDKNEIAICHTSAEINELDSSFDSIFIFQDEYNIKKILITFPIASGNALTITHNYGIVVADKDIMNRIYLNQKNTYGTNASAYSTRYAISFSDREAFRKAGFDLQEEIFDGLRDYVIEANGPESDFYASMDSLWDAEASLFGMYGTFLFLGIILGIVCLFATVLIIYYKQISEGYEDRDRFQIMKKVGMNDSEIWDSVHSQLRLVFFTPILVAGIHVCFAFPILETLLHIMLLSSTTLFLICAVLVYIVFTLVYILIYSLTAKTYYKIVH